MADTKYTQEQFNTFVNNLFAKHDTNDDNKLDKDESKAALAEAHERFGQGKPFNHEKFEEVFAEIDVDGDNHLQKEELHAFLHKIATARGQLE